MKKLLLCLLVVATGLGAALAQGITAWTTFEGPTLDWLQNEVDSFSSAFGVEVDLVKVAFGDAKQQMILGAPQGEAPDLLIGVPHDQLGEMAIAGVLADMTSFATSSYLQDLGGQARLAYTFGGKLFGLPMFVEGPALIINTDLVSEVPQTYEELIATAQALTTADTFGFLYDIGNFYFSYNWIHTFGGFVFDRDAGGDLDPAQLGVANEGAVKGAEAIKALRYDFNLIPSGTDYGVADGQFIDGTLAMIYNGPWAIPAYLDAGINLKVVPMPSLADGTPWSGFMGVQGVVMNQFSPDKVDAANLAKWLTRPDAQVSMANLSGRIPASGTALAQVQDDPIISGFGAALATAEPMPNIPAMGQVWGPMGNALTVILEAADSNVDSTLEQAASEILGN